MVHVILSSFDRRSDMLLPASASGIDRVIIQGLHKTSTDFVHQSTSARQVTGTTVIVLYSLGRFHGSLGIDQVIFDVLSFGTLRSRPELKRIIGMRSRARYRALGRVNSQGRFRK